MCEFISWIEKDGALFYLTTADIESQRGKELREYCQNDDDLRGHGAIRWFFNLEGGINKEISDFSSPIKFPLEIVNAIQAGKFLRWFGPIPCGILSATLYADYKAKCATLDADYNAKRATLYADYDAKRAPLYADYEAKCATLDADYKAKFAPLDADYKAKCAPLYADYEAKCAPLDADYEAKRATLDADYNAKFATLNADMWYDVMKNENRSEEWRT